MKGKGHRIPLKTINMLDLLKNIVHVCHGYRSNPVAIQLEVPADEFHVLRNEMIASMSPTLMSQIEAEVGVDILRYELSGVKFLIYNTEALK